MRTLELAVATVIGAGCAATPMRAVLADGTRTRAADCRTAETCFARIELTSSGIAVVAPDGDAPLALIHVRAALINTGRQLPWRFDPAATIVELGGGTFARPILANADVASLPIVLVEPGARVIVDLFAAPTDGAVVDPAVVGVVVRTRIATPDRTVVLVARGGPRGPRVDRALTPGAGSTWWADPRHRWSTFARGHGAIATRPPAIAKVIGTRDGPRTDADR